MKQIRNPILSLLQVLFISTITNAQEPVLHTVLVNEDGSFSPQRVFIHDGDTVQWDFSQPTDAIIPIDSSGTQNDLCSAYKPYDTSDPNEFTGPMPRAASGIYTLGPDGRGMTIQSIDDPDCTMDDAHTQVGNQFLCNNGPPYASMPWTWQNPNLTGVFIRLRWNEVNPAPGEFNWLAMDREIDRAVRNGKLYSISFKAGAKGTPGWIFDTVALGDNAVKPLILQNIDEGECGINIVLGSPGDSNYRKHYFNLWRAAATHIKQRNAWYRALAYVKPSGMNLFSHENRLPDGCEPECEICNPQVWAEEGGYTPEVLYDFYAGHTALLDSAFPGKDMSYMLIQNGFPLVNNHGEYMPPLTEPLPGGVEQTVTILAGGRALYGTQFVVQHNGLGQRPQDRTPTLDTCPNQGMHPAMPPFEFAGSGCPNRYVLLEGVDGQVTGFQTVNGTQGVANPVELESTLRNGWDNSDAIFIEIYEQRFWEAETAGPVLDPDATGRTIGEWAEAFYDRRRAFWPEIPDPFPMSHKHAFQRTIPPESGNQHFYYIHGSKCDDGINAKYGEIILLPDSVTSVEGHRDPNHPDQKFVLYQNFPNPFDRSTSIRYTLYERQFVELNIYNGLGHLVETLVQLDQAPAEYSIVWNRNDRNRAPLFSGIYFLELKSNGGRAIRKMVMLK